MDKIFQSAFDFFSYAIPGLVIIVSFTLFQYNITEPENIEFIKNNLDIKNGIFLIIPSYLIGFAINPLGRYLYRVISRNIWTKKNKAIKIRMHISEKYAVVRHHSPSNFKYVESWNMFCAMSHNIAVACLITLILSIIKSFQTSFEIGTWILMIPISIILFFVFIYRAYTFSIWARNDLNATIKVLDLIEDEKIEEIKP